MGWSLSLFVTAAQPARAQDEVGFDFDDPPETRIRLTDSLSLGAAADLTFEVRRDGDLDRRADDREAVLEPAVELALTFEPDERFRGFLDLELSKPFLLDSPEGVHTEVTTLEINQAYALVREVVDGLSLQIGRQEFQDEAQWFYDRELDALRAFYRADSAALEASVGQEGLAPFDLLNDDKIDRVVNGFLVGHYALGEDSGVSAFVLRRDARDGDTEDLNFLGLQSEGELAADLDYRVNGAYVVGRAPPGDGGRRIRGFGFDAFFVYAADLPWEPSAVLGVAFGSGDGGGNTDNAFRQTGLQSNEGEFNGVTSFQYYGEVLDPELSNLTIVTAGVGAKPSEGSSLDLVYHYYLQNRASDELAESALGAEPDGGGGALGHGLDLVLGFHEVEGLNSALVLGAFFPGPAFDRRADPAYFLGLELSYEF